jgi:hypothetical protein
MEICDLFEAGYEKLLVRFDDNLIFNHARLIDGKGELQLLVLLSICQ